MTRLQSKRDRAGNKHISSCGMSQQAALRSGGRYLRCGGEGGGVSVGNLTVQRVRNAALVLEIAEQKGAVMTHESCCHLHL